MNFTLNYFCFKSMLTFNLVGIYSRSYRSDMFLRFCFSLCIHVYHKISVCLSKKLKPPIEHIKYVLNEIYHHMVGGWVIPMFMN